MTTRKNFIFLTHLKNYMFYGLDIKYNSAYESICKNIQDDIREIYCTKYVEFDGTKYKIVDFQYNKLQLHYSLDNRLGYGWFKKEWIITDD